MMTPLLCRSCAARARACAAASALALTALATPALAQAPSHSARVFAPVPARAIARGEVLNPSDFVLTPLTGRMPADAILDFPSLAGMEARRDLPEGKLVLFRAIAPLRVIERNAPVTLVYDTGGVMVTADGVALADAAAGETIRAANAKTRRVVLGVAAEDGRVMVER